MTESALSWYSLALWSSSSNFDGAPRLVCASAAPALSLISDAMASAFSWHSSACDIHREIATQFLSLCNLSLYYLLSTFHGYGKHFLMTSFRIMVVTMWLLVSVIFPFYFPVTKLNISPTFLLNCFCNCFTNLQFVFWKFPSRVYYSLLSSYDYFPYRIFEKYLFLKLKKENYPTFNVWLRLLFIIT